MGLSHLKREQTMANTPLNQVLGTQLSDVLEGSAGTHLIQGLAGHDTLIRTTDKVTVHDWFARSANCL
jgi:Ca2+-binding RTX toxin-like protein